MKAFRQRFCALAPLALLAFILIQLMPAWVKIDYSLTDSPCPLHALRTQLFGHDHIESAHNHDHDHDHDHKNLMSRAERTAFFDQTGYDPYDTGIICLPGAPAVETAAKTQIENQAGHSVPDQDQTDTDKNHEKDTPKPWSCPYCTVREIALLPAALVMVPAPREEFLAAITLPPLVFINRGVLTYAYQSRAPPAFPET